MVGSERLRHLGKVSIEHVIRVASLEESEKFDVEDHQATTPEQRLAVVERLRQEWFGDFDPERRLERILACSDLLGNPLTFDRGTRRSNSRGAEASQACGRKR